MDKLVRSLTPTLRQVIKGKDVSLLTGGMAVGVSTFLGDPKTTDLILLDSPRLHLGGAANIHLMLQGQAVKLQLWGELEEQGGWILCSDFTLGFWATIMLIFSSMLLLHACCVESLIVPTPCGWITTVPLVFISYSHWKAILGGQYISRSFFQIPQGSQNAKASLV